MTNSNKDKSLADIILQRIEEEKMEPTAKWRHSTKNNIFWLFWFFSVLIGSVAVAASLFTLLNAGWSVYAATHESFFTFFIGSLPYLWLLVLGIFLLVGLENLRHTTKGYKYPVILILVMSIAGSLILGSVFYALGMGDLFDEAIGRRVPFHETVIEHQKNLWVNPELGLLAGEVTGFSKDLNVLTLQSFDGREWEVGIEELGTKDFENLASYKKVKMIGTEQGELDFYACLVLPWDFSGVVQYKQTQRREKPLPFEDRINCFSLSSKEREECETKRMAMRNTKCEDVRPYQTLQKLHNY